MARRTVTTYTSDLSGSEIKDRGSATVRFGIDSSNYEIDLTVKEADKLRKTLAPYVEAGRKATKPRGSRRTASAGGPSAKQIREWAVENGYQVPTRGRIPASIREAYDEAH